MDQVICIDASGKTDADIAYVSELRKGSIYTIIERTDNGAGIVLAEVSPPKPYKTFHTRRFRPVRPTDIAQLRRLEDSIYDERSGLAYPHIEGTKLPEGVI